MSAAPLPRAWQRMLSGRRLDLLDPQADDIAIEDIAHGLARVARWNGQTLGPHIFSVAQHSLLVERIFSARNPQPQPAAALAALLHDAAEYVVGDLISPFKAALGTGYKAVEDRVLEAIHVRFALNGVVAAVMPAIKAADRAAARLEAVELAGFSDEEATLHFGPPHPDAPEFRSLLTPWDAERAARGFHERFTHLRTGRDA